MDHNKIYSRFYTSGVEDLTLFKYKMIDKGMSLHFGFIRRKKNRFVKMTMKWQIFIEKAFSIRKVLSSIRNSYVK